MFKQNTILTPTNQPYNPITELSSEIDINVIPDKIITPENLESTKEQSFEKPQCSHNLCGPLQTPKQCEKYFLLSKLFSELDTDQKKLIARKNLGIDQVINSVNWGDISGNVKDQVDLYNYILNIVTGNSCNRSYSIQKIEDSPDVTVREQFILIDEQGRQVGDTIKVFKDSSLKSVELDDSTLKFTYILSDGQESIVDLDLSKLVSNTKFTDGLVVKDNTVSLNISKTSEDNKNFIVLESDEKALAVRSIDTDSTIVTDRILVSGGPLDSSILRDLLPKDSNGNAYIEKGTDIQSLLLSLFTKVIWPNPTVTEGTINTTIAVPSFTLNKSGTVEVGTVATLSDATLSEVVNNTTDRTISEFTYGYTTAVDGTIIKNKSITIAATNVGVNNDNYTMTRDFTGFVNTDDSATPSTTASDVKLDGTTCTIVEGTNKVKITVTGPKGTCQFAEAPQYYVASNIGTLSDEHRSPRKDLATVNESTTPSNSKELSVTGKYKYFLGYSNNTTSDQFDSASVRELTTKSDWINVNSTTTIVGATAIKSNGKSIVVACPSKYKLATINNGAGADILANFSSVGEVDIITGSITTKYKVYVYPIANGAEVEFKNVTLTKA